MTQMKIAVAGASGRMGRVPDVRRIVTKDFKRVGNRLLFVGDADASVLGGTVYADSFGQRGDRLFDPGDSDVVLRLWDALIELRHKGIYVSGSAIAEGGLGLRLFEACLGSGLGANVDLALPILEFGEFSDRREYRMGKRVPDARYDEPRRGALLFGEFIGAALIEVPPDYDDGQFPGGPHYSSVGEVIAEPKLILTVDGERLWEKSIDNLAQGWSKTFREVVE
jgi:phosphoribosylformylglycinamidine (FGAM) synthase-like enzyme